MLRISCKSSFRRISFFFHFVSNNILYLVQETFWNQNIEIIWKNIASKEKVSLDTSLKFVYVSSYLQTKKTENEITKFFCNTLKFVRPILESYHKDIIYQKFDSHIKVILAVFWKWLWDQNVILTWLRPLLKSLKNIYILTKFYSYQQVTQKVRLVFYEINSLHLCAVDIPRPILKSPYLDVTN